MKLYQFFIKSFNLFTLITQKLQGFQILSENFTDVLHFRTFESFIALEHLENMI